MNFQRLKIFLDQQVEQYNQPSFIKDDPICIPHLFAKKEDIEIAGFFAAIFAWGNRITIINKSKELMQLMDNAPHQFCVHHNKSDLKKLMAFKHRTFNITDLLYFIEFFKYHYSKNTSLESAFFCNNSIYLKEAQKDSQALVDICLNSFLLLFFSLQDIPTRTKKHIAAPKKIRPVKD